MIENRRLSWGLTGKVDAPREQTISREEEKEQIQQMGRESLRGRKRTRKTGYRGGKGIKKNCEAEEE